VSDARPLVHAPQRNAIQKLNRDKLLVSRVQSHDNFHSSAAEQLAEHVVPFQVEPRYVTYDDDFQVAGIAVVPARRAGWPDASGPKQSGVDLAPRIHATNVRRRRREGRDIFKS
jgi:hypothetical protein